MIQKKMNLLISIQLYYMKESDIMFTFIAGVVVGFVICTKVSEDNTDK